MKVLHVIHSLNGGGAETQSQLLANSLAGQNVESYFFCVDSHGHTLQDESKIVCFKRQSKFDLAIFSSIDDAIETILPDIVHAWLPAAVTIPAMISARKHQVPVVFSFRNRMCFHRPLSYFEYLAALFFSHKVISNNFIGQSSVWFRWLYRRKQGETIYNAVMPRKKKSALPVEKSCHRILYVGRLTAQKNVLLMLQALALKKDDSRWRLDIFGVGEQADMLESESRRLGLADQVNFNGYCGDIYLEMLNSDLLIFPSLYEGMPNVLIEALETGLPVIASDIASSRDLLGDTACVQWFDPKSKYQLASSLIEFLDSPQAFRDKVKKGFKVCERFSIEKLASSYNRSYRSLL